MVDTFLVHFDDSDVEMQVTMGTGPWAKIWPGFVYESVLIANTCR